MKLPLTDVTGRHGDRSERIRTYNYPQGRLTDHRIGLTLYKLEDILNGNLDEVIDALVTQTEAEKLKEVWKIHKQGDNMQTLLLDSTQENINKAGEILRNGGLVGMRPKPFTDLRQTL